jgi:thioredoxin reductase (NADPH)
VLDDVLGGWKAHARQTSQGIRVLGSQLSPQSFATKVFLSRNQIAYEWVDIDLDPAARALAESRVNDLTRLPVVIFADGSHLVAPSTAELAAKAGMHTEAKSEFYEVIVIGGGPAGLANAVYAASEGLSTVLVESHAPGGQAGTSSMIENYLGFPRGVTGEDLALRARMQAEKFGTELVLGQEVVALRRKDPYRVVVLADGTELTAYCVVISTGMSARALECPGMERLQGAGVYYGAAMTEASGCRYKDICIVGGANSAGQGALYLSRYARRVTMLIRANDLGAKMSQYLVDRIRTTENIEVVYGVTIEEVHGERSLDSVTVKSCDSGELRTIPASAMFIFIGVRPHTEAFAGVLERDKQGFLITGADLPREHGRPRGWTLEREPFMFETSIPGVFAAGDARSGANHRVAAAVGEGSAAIHSVHRYLTTV